VVAAALLFGALHKGATALDLETERVTQELSLVLQALIILSVSAEGLWDWMKRRESRVEALMSYMSPMSRVVKGISGPKLL